MWFCTVNLASTANDDLTEHNIWTSGFGPSGSRVSNSVQMSIVTIQLGDTTKNRWESQVPMKDNMFVNTQ